MKTIIFLVCCKHCHQQQQTFTKNNTPRGYKECVYCGRKFKLDKFSVIKKVK